MSWRTEEEQKCVHSCEIGINEEEKNPPVEKNRAKKKKIFRSSNVKKMLAADGAC